MSDVTNEVAVVTGAASGIGRGMAQSESLASRLGKVRRDAGDNHQLTRANNLVSDSNAASAGVENNMPTWAPSPSEDVQWIAFASKRDYGFVLCSSTGTTTPVCTTTSKIASGKQQIWISAIDVSKLGTGEDPSYPAFRVPFMELTEDCHRPFWALDALSSDMPKAGSGGSGGNGGTGGMSQQGGAGGNAGVGGAGSGSPACLNTNGNCASGICCSGLECTSDASGDNFTCQPALL